MNKLTLYRSAEKSAEDSLGLKNRHEIQSFGLAQFNQQGFDLADYDYWSQIYDAQRQVFEQLSKMPAFTKPKTA